MEPSDAKQLLETCKQDVADTREVYQYGAKFRRLKRRAKKSGKVSNWALPNGTFATVEQVWATLGESPPDQTWMSDPPDLRAPALWIATAAAAEADTVAAGGASAAAIAAARAAG